jgi:hypothetical protein
MTLRIALAVGLAVISFVAVAADAPPNAPARALLKRAVEYYQVQGDAALPAFSRQGEFLEGNRFIFVVDNQGKLLASGGPTAVLIGRDVSDVLAPEVREAFNRALGDSAPSGLQSVEYRWNNAPQGRTEIKRVYFERVSDRIIAAAQSLPHANASQAEQLLSKAVASIQRDPEITLKAINGLSADFREDDLYVFVVDERTQRYVAHGYNLRLLGVDFNSIHDPSGKTVGEPILKLMHKVDAAKYEYRWKNPVTGLIDDKYALVRKAGHYVVVVGYYRDTERNDN